MYKRTALAALGICFVLVGCKKSEPKKSARTPTPKTKQPAPASAPTSAPTVVDEGPDPVPVKPLEYQFDHTLRYGKFLGWTKDGQRYVIEATHGTDMTGTEMVTDATVRQVYDALTGLIIDAYQVVFSKPELAGGASEREERAWRQAKPAKAWKAFAAANPLVGAKPKSASPDGGWSISIKPVGSPARFVVRDTVDGALYRWTVDSEGRGRPSATISLKRQGGVAQQILRFTAPYEAKQIYEGEEIPAGIHGRIQAHWSPDSRRVLLLLRAETGAQEKIEGKLQIMISNFADTRYYVRSAGPQIKLSCHRTSEVGARRLARRLAGAGLFVTQLVFVDKPHEKTEIYHRSDEALANKAAAAIGGSPAMKPLGKQGWLDLIILLR